MSFYKTGTVTVTNGSPTVVGVSTLWNSIGVLNAGDIFMGPDGVVNEILSFQSNTGLTLASNYLGATLAGQAYDIIPIGLLPSTLALAVKETLTTAQAALVGTVSTVAAQGLSAAQQDAARANILALGAVNVGNGYLSKSVAGGADVVLTAAEAANQFIEFTGVITADINVVVPAAARLYGFKNSTTGAYKLTVKTPAGTGILVPQTTGMLLEANGTNVINPITAVNAITVNSGTAYAGQSVVNNGTLDIPMANGGNYLAVVASTNGIVNGATLYHVRNGIVTYGAVGVAPVGCTLTSSGLNVRFTNTSGSTALINFAAIRIA
jgi:hypothetical protein